MSRFDDDDDDELPYGASRTPRLIKLMLSEGLGRPDARWAVCTADVGRPARGCLWRILEYHWEQEAALKAMRKLPEDPGRAVVRMDYPKLRIIDRDGVVRFDSQAERELLA